MYLFVAIANVTDSVNHIFFSSGCMSLPFQCVGCTHVLKFSSGNVPLNFVWLSHDALSLTINVLIVFFSFIILILCELQHLFPLFWVELSHTSLSEFHTNALRVLSLIVVWMSQMIFFVWMSYEYPFVSITFKRTLHVVSC